MQYLTPLQNIHCTVLPCIRAKLLGAILPVFYFALSDTLTAINRSIYPRIEVTFAQRLARGSDPPDFNFDFAECLHAALHT